MRTPPIFRISANFFPTWNDVYEDTFLDFLFDQSFQISLENFLSLRYLDHKSTILTSFFPGSCFSRLSVKVLFNRGSEEILFNRKERRFSFEVQDERILTDQSGKKNLERITRYLKFLGVQRRFFFLSLKGSCLNCMINGTWYIFVHILIYIYISWALFIHL
jgi:hypothetical protein